MSMGESHREWKNHIAHIGESIAVKFLSNSCQILAHTNIPERDRTYTQSKRSNLCKKNAVERRDRTTERQTRTTRQNHV